MISIETQNKLHDAAAYISNVKAGLRGIAYKTANGGEFTDLEVDGMEMVLNLALELINSVDA